MTISPSVVVFDVNETLSDMSPMGQCFAQVGAPEPLAKLWFASVLRDGFASGLAGRQERFSVLARENLCNLLAPVDLDRDLQTAVDHIMSGFLSLSTHVDVAPGVRALRAAGHRLVTLSNGAADVAESLLASARIRDEFEQLLSVEDAGMWKPARVAYEHAAQKCGVNLQDMVLVAVHPWDIDGASRAGMRTALGQPIEDQVSRARSFAGLVGEFA